jgi:septal ring factor EnvC (AmiA/AmiB activator)
MSKGDLRAQIEKLEQANAKLRAKAREAGRDAKISATRIAELEKQVAQLEGQPKPKAAAAESPAKPSKSKASKPRRLKVLAGGTPPGAGNGEDTSSDRNAAGEAGAA